LDKTEKKFSKEDKEIKLEQLPSKSNFIEWYNAVLRLAEIADNWKNILKNLYSKLMY